MTQSKITSAKPSRRRVLKGAAAITAGLAAPTFLKVGSALAAYPDRPVKIVVANTPGGPSDIIARFMAAAMTEPLGGSVIVENRGGAGGNIGMGFAARAEPDGYTILLTTSAFAVNPGLYNSLPYDPFKDFAPICELAVSPHVFAVKPDLGVNTMKEFVALAKKDPSKFNVSAPPIGTTPQLQAEVLKTREGLAGHGDRGVRRRRRRAEGADQRHRAAVLRRARAGASADQGRDDQGPGRHRHQALARPARYPDHG